jgi:hypothetical protein
MSTPEPVRGLLLEASCVPARFGDQETRSVEARIVNVGDKRVNIRRDFVPSGNLYLDLADSTGREVHHRRANIRLARALRKEDFVQLDPGCIYGVRVRLISGARDAHGVTYSLVSWPDVPNDYRVFIGSPGRYSLVLTYQTSDGGTLAGLTAWTGVLRSANTSCELR